MENCVSSVAHAPIRYINDMRYLKTGSIMMRSTNFYPAFPLAIFSCLLATIGLSAYIIVFFFQNDQG